MRLLSVILSLALWPSFAFSQKEAKISAKDFIEPDIPVFRSALVIKEGKKQNRVRRGVIVKLNATHWACFDPDLLRWAAVWKTKPGQSPITYDSMAAVSYPNQKAKARRAPQLQGKVLMTTTEVPGISANAPSQDPRVTELLQGEGKVGPVYPTTVKFLGVKLKGTTPVLQYRLGTTTISETASFQPNIGWVRVLHLEAHPKPLSLQLTTSGLFSSESASPILDDSFLIPPSSTEQVLTFSQKSFDFEALELPENSSATNIFSTTLNSKQGPPTTQKTFTVRDINFPESPRAVRAVDIAFRKDGRAYLATLDGDIWEISDIESETPTWTRFAFGLFEPMAIEIDSNDRIFVLGRDQITELIDENADGFTDFYRNASDIFQQTLHTRDYATSLAIGEDGSFYIAKGGIHNPKSKSDNELSAHRGTILQISPDGNTAKILADGLRLPFVGLSPKGTVFASDQQGHYVPSTPLYRITQGIPYFGFKPTKFRKDIPLSEPSLWYPYLTNRSSAGFTTTSPIAFPDLAETFLQVSWNGRLFAIEESGKGQLFSWQLPLQLDFPSLNGASHPISGKLYLTGLGISGYKPTTAKTTGLASIAQTSSLPRPADLALQGDSLFIRFAEPLAESVNIPQKEIRLRLYNIERTPQYGSGHSLWNGKRGEHHFSAKAAQLSSDRQTLTLDFDLLRQSEVLDLSLTLEIGEQKIPLHFFTSASHLPEADSSEIAELVRQEKEKAKSLGSGKAKLGKAVFKQYACATCHSVKNENLTGPPLRGLGARSTLSQLRESILEPNARITPGFQPNMPSFAGVIPDQDLVHLLKYLKTL